eukprot:383912-Pyramimonas_sp.AAC.1
MIDERLASARTLGAKPKASTPRARPTSSQGSSSDAQMAAAVPPTTETVPDRHDTYGSIVREMEEERCQAETKEAESEDEELLSDMMKKE